ncbi:MAG: hypothetical protein WBQ56_03860 [Candidatus Sulfotelmatobacter sp.]
MDYKKTREDAQWRREKVMERLFTINEERAALQRELAAIDQILEGLDIYQSDAPLEGEASGVSDHVRRLLQQTPVPLLPTQIREALTAIGITGSSRKNLLISVHNVLSRLDRYLETTEINNRPAYRWKQDADRATKRGISRSDKSQASLSEKNK